MLDGDAHMTRTDQIAKATAFREMHRGSPALLLPNAWDAVSARLFQESGFRAVATTSGGLAWALGYADGEGAPWPEIIAATRRIARVLSVPLSADIETGFGSTPADVAR
ncbi:MAG: isocitrate lyase/phosphoenolpyruvate mutase family protein, partial [Hyphomicrobiaceae bacterium]